METPWNGEATVLQKRRLGPEGREMVLEIPWEGRIFPGQFCYLRVEPTFDPLLRRPFSYWEVTRPRRGISRITLVFSVVGRATELLARKDPGDRVGYLGPLGNGFRERPARTCVLVAGGMGIVPFHHWVRYWRSTRPRSRIMLFFGGRTASRLYGIDAFPPLGVETYAATEDGSRGRKGLVTDLLEEHLPALQGKGLRLYACGPDGMIEAVARIARRRRIPCRISLERRMGCALGACGACVVRIRSKGEPGWRHSRICVEGPVYEAGRLKLA